MRGAIPPLPSTSSLCGAWLSTGTTLPYDPGHFGPKFHTYTVLMCVFSASLFCNVFYVLVLTL
jgi:hypothetical protein